MDRIRWEHIQAKAEEWRALDPELSTMQGYVVDLVDEVERLRLAAEVTEIRLAIYRACANGMALSALESLMEMLDSFNVQNPWLGVTAAVVLLKLEAEKAENAHKA